MRKTPLVELKQYRETYGNDESAINRHSVRLYQHGKRLFILDKTLDACPPCFNLSEIQTKDGVIVDGTVNHTIRVNDKEYWGDGFPWAKAERAVMTTLDAAGISRDKTTIFEGRPTCLQVPPVAKAV